MFRKALSFGGMLLLAVNSADARLSVFKTNHSPPLLVEEIPVGIEPVSVNARTDDEAWVVNELSDSVSVVSISQGIVTDTINVKDEPADVVFAGGLAFVSVSGNNEVRVFNATTHKDNGKIPLLGQRPRGQDQSQDAVRQAAQGHQRHDGQERRGGVPGSDREATGLRHEPATSK